MAASTQAKKNEALGRDEASDEEEAAGPKKRGLPFRKRAKEEQAGEEASEKEPEQHHTKSMLQRAVEKGKARVAEEAEERVKEAVKEERKKWSI